MPDFQDLLREETAAYESDKARLLSEGLAGKWAVYLGTKRIGVFDDAQVAHTKGIEVAGLARPFLMKRIGDDDILSLPALFFGLIHAGN